MINLFKKSFQRIDTRFFFVMGYDALFYILFFVFLFLWKSTLSYLHFVDLSTINLGNFESLMQRRALLRQNTINILLSLFLLVVMIFFSFTLSRSLIFSTILKKRFKTINWLRFTLLKFINLWIFLIPFLISVRMFLSNIYLGSFLFYLSLLLSLHFNFVSYAIFTQKNKIGNAIKEAFAIAFGRIHKFIVPYLFVILVIAIIALINQLVLLLPKLITTILQFLISFSFLAWLRFYLVSAVAEIEK